MSPLCQAGDTALGTPWAASKGCGELERQRAQVHTEEQQHLSDSTPFTPLLLHFLIIPRKKPW